MFFDINGRVICMTCRAKMRLAVFLTEVDGRHVATFECSGCGHNKTLVLSPPAASRGVPGSIAPDQVKYPDRVCRCS